MFRIVGPPVCAGLPAGSARLAQLFLGSRLPLFRFNSLRGVVPCGGRGDFRPYRDAGVPKIAALAV
jgi:hypothetical protein